MTAWRSTAQHGPSVIMAEPGEPRQQLPAPGSNAHRAAYGIAVMQADFHRAAHRHRHLAANAANQNTRKRKRARDVSDPTVIASDTVAEEAVAPAPGPGPRRSVTATMHTAALHTV